MGEGDQKAQTSSYKIDPGDVMYSMGTIVNDTKLKVAMKADLKSFIKL